MYLDINIYGSVMEWSRLLDFCTETGNKCSEVFKRWMFFRKSFRFLLIFLALLTQNIVCVFYLSQKIWNTIHIDNIGILLHVRNLTSCTTVSIQRTLLHFIKWKFPFSEMYFMWSGFLLFGETDHSRETFTTWTTVWSCNLLINFQWNYLDRLNSLTLAFEVTFQTHKSLCYGIQLYCERLHHVCGHIHSLIHSLVTFATLSPLELLSMLANLPHTQMLIISTRLKMLHINTHILRFSYCLYVKFCYNTTDCRV